jgi:hypothetical protein
MKQTAVEWLGNELESFGSTEKLKLDWLVFDELIKQAKEMEKEQIVSAFNHGEFFPSDYYHPNNPSVDGSETYYNETYGGNK